jgi:uncharacterized protein (DUF2132 family)
MTMNDEMNYKNNPLHGVSLKNLLVEMVDHYGFSILYAYLNINCFKSNPSIDSSVKFLKKTDWAREKVEAFYLYQFKSLPRASAEQFELPPRDRIIPADEKPGEPAELSLEDAERLREKRAKKAATRAPSSGYRSGSNVAPSRSDRYESRRGNSDTRHSSPSSASTDSDPWAKWRK